MNKIEIQAALAASQTDFVAMLAQFSEQALQQSQETEPWTPAVIMLHMCEAREHYAADVQRLIDSDFQAAVGRSTEHPGRLAVIAAAAQDGQAAATIAARLEESYAKMMTAVDAVAESAWERPVTLNRPGQRPLTVGEFLERFLVSHHQAHVDQLRALR